MNTLLVILWLAGAGTLLAGIGGFVDGRKVDRRFKTGYKNNAADTRNFRQAGKRVMWGVGICIAAMVIGALSSSNEHQHQDDTAKTSEPASPATTLPVAANAESASASVTPAPVSNEASATDASISLSSNERVVQAAPISAPPTPVSETPAAESTPIVSNGGPQAACNDDGTFLGSHICRSAALATIYQRELGEYEAAQSRIGGADVGVRAEQQRWLAQVAQDCPDMQCLTAAFDKRITDLSSRYHGG